MIGATTRRVMDGNEATPPAGSDAAAWVEGRSIGAYPELTRKTNQHATISAKMTFSGGTTLESSVLDNRDVLIELAALHGSGLKVGLSLSGPNQGEVLCRALDVTNNGKRLFDCVQATWNLLEPSAGAALQEAHDSGVGVIVKEALANGRLTERNTEPSFAAKKEVLAREAIRLGTRLDALALAAVLAQRWVDVVLSGAATVDQLKSNVEANAVQWDSEASMKLGQLAETPSVYWAARAGLAWN
jgi:Aldo/keto reductase family